VTATLVQFTIRVPRPWVLTSNQRLHWAPRSQRTKYIRSLARFETRSRFRGMHLPAASCEVWVTWPDKRRRDTPNTYPTIKACIDGIVDAGLLSDDADEYLKGLKIQGTDDRCATAHVEFTFVFTPTDPPKATT